MREVALNEQATADAKRPGDLTAGDVVVLDGVPFELLSEPFLGMTGTSLFDMPELFWRARVRWLGGAQQAVGYVTWAADEPVAEAGRL
jgi:hypothetical protein